MGESGHLAIAGVRVGLPVSRQCHVGLWISRWTLVTIFGEKTTAHVCEEYEDDIVKEKAARPGLPEFPVLPLGIGSFSHINQWNQNPGIV